LDLIVGTFPNSADIELNAQHELFEYQDLCFTVFDVAGRTTAQDAHVQNSGIQEMEISTNNLSNGLYHLVIETKNDRIVKKFVVTHR